MGQIKQHKRGQACYTVRAGGYPLNTRPYRLPVIQREEIDRQVKQLLEEGITAKSDSAWKSPLLVVPKKVGPDGKRKWHLVVDFRKLDEKTGMLTPYLISLKYWTSWVSLSILHA